MKIDDPRHGTNAGYIAHALGDRDYCQPCRDAHRNYRKRALIRANTNGPMWVDKTGSVRRVQALLALGHTHAAIARAGSGTPNASKNVLNARFKFVHRDTFEVILTSYGKLSMVAPKDWRAQEHRRRALARGYVPPLAWDDDTIDDPNALPQMAETSIGKFTKQEHEIDSAVVQRFLDGDTYLNTTNAERREIVRRWGRPLNELERLGWKPERYSPKAGGSSCDPDEMNRGEVA